MAGFKEFIKYQSLGNDFVVVDWFKKPDTYLQSMLHDQDWAQFVRGVCDRHTGVGADGILIIKSNQKTHMPEMLIFNADGSRAENCLNGLRCVADYLFSRRQLPAKFPINIGPRQVLVSVMQAQKNDPHTEIITNVGRVQLGEIITISTADGSFRGCKASVGNPHFIIQQQVDRSLLEKIGGAIMTHKEFPQQTNVEFVWRNSADEALFYLMVYERGVGVTNACSSGAAAVIRYLVENKEIMRGQKATLVMIGGSVQAWVDHEDDVYLQASARCVFDGVLGS